MYLYYILYRCINISAGTKCLSRHVPPAFFFSAAAAAAVDENKSNLPCGTQDRARPLRLAERAWHASSPGYVVVPLVALILRVVNAQLSTVESNENQLYSHLSLTGNLSNQVVTC